MAEQACDQSKTKHVAPYQNHIHKDLAMSSIASDIDPGDGRMSPSDSGLEANTRQQKLEWINKWLKQERQTLVDQISKTHFEMKSAKEGILHLQELNDKLQKEIQAKIYEGQKMKDQLSVTLQENSSLREVKAENQVIRTQLAVVSEENTKLQHQMAHMRKKLKGNIESSLISNTKDEEMRLLPEDFKLFNFSDVHLRVDRSVKSRFHKLKVLEKRHSSPQFYPLSDKDSVEEMSHKLLQQGKQEQEELQQQMEKLQKASGSCSSGSSTFPSSFSIIEMEELEASIFVQDIHSAVQRMRYMEEGVHSVNETLRKLMLNLKSRPNYKRKETRNNPQQAVLPFFANYVRSPGSISSDMYIDSARTDVNLDQCSKFQQESHRAGCTLNTNIQQISDDSIPRSLGLRRESSAEVLVGSPPGTNVIVTPEIAEQCQQPFAESTTPVMQTLLPEPMQDIDLLQPRVLDGEDRDCPVCNAVFPKSIDGDYFVKHVYSHYDLEEYEIIE